MKKAAILIISIAFVLVLLSCKNKLEQPVNDELNNKSSASGVSIVLQTYSNTGLTFVFNNDTNNDYTYGAEYKLYVFENGTWTDVPYIIDNWAFTSIGYSLKSNTISEKIDVDWLWLYGEIPDGKYKFEKTILFVREPGDYDTCPLSTEFELINGEPIKATN